MKCYSPVSILPWILLTLLSCEPVTPSPSTPTGASSPRVINQTNYSPIGLADSLITQAAALDSYFQHASVGGNFCGGLDALALESGSRYKMDRTGDGDTPPDWFKTHNGLADYNRANPGASEKINLFTTAFQDSVLASNINVASYKFCYIDSPADAQALFNEAKAAMESLETTYPLVSFVWWTMPLAPDANLERQKYNELVRAYCFANQKWLLDIADLECHDEMGVKRIDSNGLELLSEDYAVEFGHLNALGSRKIALAWWKILSEIAQES